MACTIRFALLLGIRQPNRSVKRWLGAGTIIGGLVFLISTNYLLSWTRVILTTCSLAPIPPDAATPRIEQTVHLLTPSLQADFHRPIEIPCVADSHQPLGWMQVLVGPELLIRQSRS